MKRSLRLMLLASVLAQPVWAQTAEPPPSPPAETAPPREVLPGNAAPQTYRIEIAPDVETLTFTARAEIELEILEATDRLVLNARDLSVESAALGSVPSTAIEFDEATERVAFVFASPIQPGTHTLNLVYSGKIYETSSGLFVTPYTQGGVTRRMLSSQFEAGYARRLAPMWDEPSAKAVFEMALIVPAGEMAVSNMPIKETRPLGGGLKRVSFESTPKMSSYLLFVGAGDLERTTRKTGAVETGVITRRGDSVRGNYALEVSGPILDYYNDYFATAYPLPKLDHFAAPGAGGFGAMENWGAIFYFETSLLVDPALSTEADRQRVFGTIAHEIAHQWFGNLVTMSWWDDLWLNEGFASWMEKKASDRINPEWDVWLQALKGQQDAMQLDARASTHAVVQPLRTVAEAETAFDDITYDKGEAVIRMIEAYLGEEPFRDGVRAYMEKHAYGNTTTEDLWSALQAASDTPVVDIARDFTTKPGIPLVTVGKFSCRDGRTFALLRQDRFAVDASANDAQRWQVPVVAAGLAGGEPAHLVLNGEAEISVPGCGPVKINVGNTGYFRTLYDTADFAALKAWFARLPEADQLGLLHDTWALAAAAYQPMADYLGLTTAVAADADPLVWLQVAGTFSVLADLYRGVEGADRFAAFARARLAPKLKRIGWEQGKDEPPNVGVLRAALIETLAQLEDPDVFAEASKRFSAFRANPASLTGDIRRSVTRAVAMNADAGMWSEISDLAANAPSPLEQRFYLDALTYVRDEDLARQSLGLAIAESTPKQYGPRMIKEIARRHPDLAWAFVNEHQAAIDDRLDAFGRASFIPEIASMAADPVRADELKAFFAKALPGSPDAEMKRAIDKILSNSDIKTKRLPKIDEWLAQAR